MAQWFLQKQIDEISAEIRALRASVYNVDGAIDESNPLAVKAKALETKLDDLQLLLQSGDAKVQLSSDNRLPVEVAGEVGITGGAASNLQIIADNQGRLYGRTASGSWLPVRVNSSGQLELAQNVVIDNVTVNVGAEVKVNNTPEDPVNVQLSGNIVELGLLADRPTATPENKGMGYFAWDAPEGNKLTYSDGTKWVVS